MSAGPGQGALRWRGALRHRNFRLFWFGQLISLDRHLDAVARPGVADPAAHPRPDLARVRRGGPVPARPDPRPVRWRHRGRPAEAEDDHRHAGRVDDPGSRPRRAHVRERDPGLAHPRPRGAARVRQRRRHADAPGVRGRDGRPRGRHERGRPELGDVQRGPDRGPGHRRDPDRRSRRHRLLLPQRHQLRRGDRRTAPDARGGPPADRPARPSDERPRRRRQPGRGPAVRPGDPGRAARRRPRRARLDVRHELQRRGPGPRPGRPGRRRRRASGS